MAFYASARKIHRYFVLIILAIGGIMTVTGISLKYSIGDTLLTRFIHNNLSVVFTAVLVIMMFTGAFLYFYPGYIRKKQEKAEKKGE